MRLEPCGPPHPSRRRFAPPQDEGGGKPTLRRPCRCGAGHAVVPRLRGDRPLFLPQNGGWSAGRRQGACETPLADLAIGPPERLRGVPPSIDGGGRRLPALHHSISGLPEIEHSIVRTSGRPDFRRHGSRTAGRDQHKCGFEGGDKFIFLSPRGRMTTAFHLSHGERSTREARRVRGYSLTIGRNPLTPTLSPSEVGYIRLRHFEYRTRVNPSSGGRGRRKSTPE